MRKQHSQKQQGGFVAYLSWQILVRRRTVSPSALAVIALLTTMPLAFGESPAGRAGPQAAESVSPGSFAAYWEGQWDLLNQHIEWSCGETIKSEPDYKFLRPTRLANGVPAAGNIVSLPVLMDCLAAATAGTSNMAEETATLDFTVRTHTVSTGNNLSVTPFQDVVP